MRTDYHILKKFDFISIKSKKWGLVSCVVTLNSNKKKRLRFLDTKPYEETEDRNFKYFTFEDSYEDFEGFYFNKTEDIFPLLGVNEKIIIEMICRISENE